MSGPPALFSLLCALAALAAVACTTAAEEGQSDGGGPADGSGGDDAVGSGGGAGAAGEAPDATPTTCDAPPVTSGSFSVLTYNVAGLPEGISQSHPAVNLALISPLLNPYDLVLVQENFTYLDYPEKLRSGVTHPYVSTPKSAGALPEIGDGLNTFSTLCFEAALLQRAPWTECFGTATNGSDCITSKGFSVAEHYLAVGVSVHVYNLHMDAGGAAEDQAARAGQIDQLLAEIASRSAGRAIVLAGDTNMGPNEAPLAKLLADGELTDACRALSCGSERIDRVMFRSSPKLELTPTTWGVAGEFVDGSGAPLSDHQAIAVELDWQKL